MICPQKPDQMPNALTFHMDQLSSKPSKIFYGMLQEGVRSNEPEEERFSQSILFKGRNKNHLKVILCSANSALIDHLLNTNKP